MIIDTRPYKTTLYGAAGHSQVARNIIEYNLINPTLEAAFVIAPLYALGEIESVDIELADFRYLIDEHYTGVLADQDTYELDRLMYHLLTHIDQMLRPQMSYLYTRDISNITWHGDLLNITLEQMES